MSFIKSKLQTAINNNMKNTFKTLLFISLLCGVSGADEMKSVMEGDSVTLQTEEKILTYNQIMWRFGVALIAEITDGGKIEDVTDGRFSGRLKLDLQTGSLTITNTRTIHSGDYKIQIETNTGPIEKRFTLTVYESPFVIDPDRGEVKPVSVTEGEPVSLNTDIKPHGDELILWWFGCILIAKDDKENNKISFSPDERFKGRIHLDQTGSLIITDSRTADTGEYKLKISSNRDTKHKRFNLYVSDPGLSAGAKAGIIIAVVCAVLYMIAAAAVGVIYYRRRTSEQRQKQEQERLKDERRTVFMMKGESVPLITDDAHIKTDDVNVYYRDTLIVEIRGGKITSTIYDVIRERLKLDQTGSLIISNSRRTDSGVYKLKIINSTEEITYKRIIVTVSDDEVIIKTVKKENPVYLSSDVPEIQEDAEVEWKIAGTVIAHKKQKDKTISLCQDALDEDLIETLKVNQQTGSLFITNFTLDHPGNYELKIISSRLTVYQKFHVTVYDEYILNPVKEGDSVIEQPADGVKKLDVFNIEADDGVNESDSLMNNAAADEGNESQGTSSV